MSFWHGGVGYNKIKGMIKGYQKRGFYQMRFPGGTSYNGKINSSVIVVDFHNNYAYFILIPYDNKSNLIREESNNSESRAHLAVRKLRDETGLIAEATDFKEPILEIVVNDNRFADNQKHIKYFFLIEKSQCKGQLINLENSSFLNRETATPIWVPASLVPKVLFFKHLEVFEMIIDKMSSQIRNYEEIKRMILNRKNRVILKNKKTGQP